MMAAFGAVMIIAIWCSHRGGRKVKGQATNILAVVVVAAIVAGAVWFKAQRADQDSTEQTPSTDATSVVQTDPAAGVHAPVALSESSDTTDEDKPVLAPPESEATTDADELALGETEPAGTVDAHKPTVEQPGPFPDKKPTAAENVKIPRLVDLGAGKCKQCKALAPILDALREEYKGRLSVEFIDVWKNPKASEPYKIRLIPTQILYDKDGNELWRHEGFISKEDLKTLFAEKVGVK